MMANSNRRVKEYETVHHLVSRIAHRVYFLKDDERGDFLEIVRRAAEFTGVLLLGWCIMGKHFLLLVFLPSLQEVDEAEVLRRYGILKGEWAADEMKRTFEKWRMEGESVSVKLHTHAISLRVFLFLYLVRTFLTVECFPVPESPITNMLYPFAFIPVPNCSALRARGCPMTDSLSFVFLYSLIFSRGTE